MLRGRLASSHSKPKTGQRTEVQSAATLTLCFVSVLSFDNDIMQTRKLKPVGLKQWFPKWGAGLRESEEALVKLILILYQ